MNINESIFKETFNYGAVQTVTDICSSPLLEHRPYQPMPQSIAVLTCSTRPSRIGPLISQHVTTILTSRLSTYSDQDVHISPIDLASHSLPLLDEPGIPSKLPASNPTPFYAHAHSRAWSAEILKHAAFIFIIPQYNWGYPASIKNALDYLFHEWAGKPALVVSYGGRGGGKAATQLVEVCRGMRMRIIEPPPGYKISIEESADAIEKRRFNEERLEVWRSDNTDEELAKRFEELLEVLP